LLQTKFPNKLGRDDNLQQDETNELFYIVESKEKCLNAGMDPNKLTFSKVILSEQELTDKKLAYGEILEVVSFFSKKMLRSLEGTPMVICISDEKGIILEMIGNEVMISTMSQLNVKPGVQFSQEDRGTNVISLTLQQNRPVQLIGTDHYHTFLHNSACYGVPFHYTDGNNLLGGIYIMTAVVLHNPFFLMTLETVVDSIERELLLRKQNRKLNIMNQIMLSKTRNGIIITDTEGKITQCNRFAEKIFGYSKEQTIGTIVLDSPVTGKYFKDVLQNEGIYEDFEMRFTNNKGENYICLFDAQPIHAENLKIVGAFGQFRDITERYLAEKKYKDTEKAMSRLDRLNLIGQMAASIGHEVRNPMTTVRGFLQLLGNKTECLQYNDYFTLMIEELDRANAIITEFLSLAKDRVVDLKVQSLTEIVQNIFPLIQADGVISGKYIHLKLNEVPKIPLDKKEIHQLILNLVLNASQAMSSGGNMEIRTYMEKDEIILAVQDDGIGIEPEVLGKIGTPFFTTKDNGTGLGLAVCYSIVARHNAKIDIETSSTGTTFFIRFKKY